MKFLDLLQMSIDNLKRRKVRTALTVLGVLIGTISVVTMVSLGVGLDTYQTKLFAESGSLKAITVRSADMYGNTNNKNPNYIKDETIKLLENLEHVEYVSPVLNTSVILKQGNWEASVSLTGVSRRYLEQIPLGEGSLPVDTGKSVSYIIGNMIITDFRNIKTNKSYYDTGELPSVDYFNKSLFSILDTEAYYASQGAESETPAPKKYLFPVAGVVKGSTEEYNEYAYSIYTDIEALKTQLKKIYKSKAIPGQPTTKKGKPYKYFVYEQAIVYVDDMENVTKVQKTISDMGFQANSNMEWLEQSKGQSRMVQAILGGIGAVSLFVAAIGIANTMMMSIYERTKEIGIMKVLGCDMGKIRDMFLIESGCIGFFGGVVGLILSYMLSMIINHFTKQGMGASLSVIPFVLAFFAIVFSTLIGMLAGFLPAMRAMKLSPLSALRND